MEIKSMNLKLNKSEIARELKKSSSTSQQYRRETNMPSPVKYYHLQTLTQENKRLQTIMIMTSKRTQMTSKRPQMTSK